MLWCFFGIHRISTTFFFWLAALFGFSNHENAAVSNLPYLLSNIKTEFKKKHCQRLKQPLLGCYSIYLHHIIYVKKHERQTQRKRLFFLLLAVQRYVLYKMYLYLAGLICPAKKPVYISYVKLVKSAHLHAVLRWQNSGWIWVILEMEK